MPAPLSHFLSPEARLLLLTAGGPENDAEIVSLARQGIDWRRLTRIAESERAEPVAVRRIRAVLGTRLPDEAARLEQLARVADFRQAWIEERLAASLAVLGQARIDVVLLKGAALAISDYGSFLERPMADLDFLVDPSRADEAHRLLRTAGWSWRHNPKLDDFYATHHHLAPLHDARGVGVGLDLHTTPVCAGNPFGLDGELMRRRATRVSFKGLPAFLPESHDQLLHLCVHLSWSHVLASGSWRAFRDVATLVRSGRIDWGVFIGRSRTHHAQSCCYWVLRLANLLAGVPVPAGVLRALRPRGPGVVLRTLERHYILNLLPSESRSASVRLDHFLWEVGVQPTLMGHGRTRPWDRSTAFSTLRGAPAGASPRTMATRVGRIRAFGEYTRAMIGAG